MRSLVWKLVLGALTLALVAAPLPGTSTAWAASPALEEAQALYDGAKFTDAVAKIREALSAGQLAGKDAIAARALMARCLVKSGNRLEAKQAFKFVLRQQPGWRPDASVGPDEVEVFELAQKEITAEQIEAGKRIPASLAFYYGVGSGDNKNFAEFIHSNGGPDKMDNKPMFGGSVRFPLHPRWSLDLELSRFRATASDPNGVQYEASAIPLVANVVFTPLSSARFRAGLFAGAGPMMSSKLIEKVSLLGTTLSIFDEKTGVLFQGGVEGEYLPITRVGLYARAYGRSASATKFFGDSDPSFPLYKKKLDFSGYGLAIGLRGYIGY